MSTLVQPQLARFAADLNDAWEKICESAPDEFYRVYGPIEIRLYTVDGFTAKLWEEGIEFYPKEDAA